MPKGLLSYLGDMRGGLDVLVDKFMNDKTWGESIRPKAPHVIDEYNPFLKVLHNIQRDPSNDNDFAMKSPEYARSLQERGDAEGLNARSFGPNELNAMEEYFSIQDRGRGIDPNQFREVAMGEKVIERPTNDFQQVLGTQARAQEPVATPEVSFPTSTPTMQPAPSQAPTRGPNTGWINPAAPVQMVPKANFRGEASQVIANPEQLFTDPDLFWIANKESHFHPNLMNKNGNNFGLGQMSLVSRKLYGKKFGFNADTINPVEQAVMMDAYVKDRYGSPKVARKFWETTEQAKITGNKDLGVLSGVPAKGPTGFDLRDSLRQYIENGWIGY